MALLKPYFNLDLTQPIGDPIIIPLRFKDADGNYIAVDSWEFWYTLKANYTDADVDAIARLVPGDPGIVFSEYPSGSGTNSRVDLVIEHTALTALVVDQEYYHDVQVNPGDSRPYTYAKGIFIPTWEGTKATP